MSQKAPARLKAGYAQKHIMITGGLGMIGSTIAHRCVSLGAHVTIVDACISPYGANFYNLEGIRDQVQVNISDIRDKASMAYLVKDKDIIFNLAGQVSHNDSMEDPFLDVDINYLGHLNVAESLRHNNPSAVVLHAGSRLQYGRILSNPVDESHPLHPRTPYALHKTAAEEMYQYYHQIHGLNTVAFRIANPFGPRSQMRHAKYSMVNWFIRCAMEGQTLRIFGDGNQVRDYIYVEDLADAFIWAAITPEAIGGTFNIGSGVPTAFKTMVQKVVQVVASGEVAHVPWPDDYIHVETGDYIADISKFTNISPWRPTTSFEDGLRQTVAYYRNHKDAYWSS